MVRCARVLPPPTAPRGRCPVVGDTFRRREPAPVVSKHPLGGVLAPDPMLGLARPPPWRRAPARSRSHARRWTPRPGEPPAASWSCPCRRSDKDLQTPPGPRHLLHDVPLIGGQTPVAVHRRHNLGAAGGRCGSIVGRGSGEQPCFGVQDPPVGEPLLIRAVEHRRAVIAPVARPGREQRWRCGGDRVAQCRGGHGVLQQGDSVGRAGHNEPAGHPRGLGQDVPPGPGRAALHHPCQHHLRDSIDHRGRNPVGAQGDGSAAPAGPPRSAPPGCVRSGWRRVGAMPQAAHRVGGRACWAGSRG